MLIFDFCYCYHIYHIESYVSKQKKQENFFTKEVIYKYMHTFDFSNRKSYIFIEVVLY